MNEMTVTVFEQPGALGKIKAQALSQLLQQFFLNAPQEIRDEIDRRAEELHCSTDWLLGRQEAGNPNEDC